jgi:hypothetical protein
VNWGVVDVALEKGYVYEDAELMELFFYLRIVRWGSVRWVGFGGRRITISAWWSR